MTIYYYEFEFNGKKIFKDIPSSDKYIDGRPATYGFIYIYDEMFGINSKLWNIWTIKIKHNNFYKDVDLLIN